MDNLYKNIIKLIGKGKKMNKATPQREQVTPNRETAKQVRRENYLNSLRFHQDETEMVMQTITLLTANSKTKQKTGVGPSEVYKYMLDTGRITQQTPLTNIRRCFDTLKKSNESKGIDAKIVAVKKIQSVLYKRGTEMGYKPAQVKSEIKAVNVVQGALAI